MNSKLTYCNPLSIEDIKSGRWLDVSLLRTVFPDYDERTFKDYRSISDPSVIYHDGKWILYPSYAVAYVSEDFVHWKHVDIGVSDLRYSPAVTEFRGKWYLGGHGMSELYVADDPLGPFTLAGHFTDVNGNVFKPIDSCFFADGDRFYMYWFAEDPEDKTYDVEMANGTVGAECDPDEPWKLITEPVFIQKFDPNEKWQRTGEYNQNERMGWCEGQWMIKIGKRYYHMFSGSGTQYGSYANGISYSDEGPLSGFKCQKNNPLSVKKTGLVRGAGHGSIVEGPNNTYWLFYTNYFCYNARYERRISMDPIGIDENGELYCPNTTETPQYAPGVLEHPEKGNGVGLLPLTFYQIPFASSAVEAREAIYASDDNVLSFWQPKADDPDKCITFQLGGRTRYEVSSIRIIWRDVNMESLDGIVPGPFQYVVEYADTSDMKNWLTLVDASSNDKDLCIDYRQFEPVKAYAVRLRITGAPKGIEPGVVSFTAFGVCEHEK